MTNLAESALAAVIDRYANLQQDEWKMAGSTGRPQERSEHKPKVSKVHAPLPINVDVVSFLAEADEAIVGLEREIASRLGTWAVTSTVRPDRATPRGVRGLRAIAATAALPDDLAERAQLLLDDLDTVTARLMGDTIPRRPLTRCPRCGCSSVVLNPDDDDQALCGNRRCLTDDGERVTWSRAGGQWRALGWETAVPATLDADGRILAVG